MIQVSDLHKKFRDNLVLRGVDLSIDKGETLVIIGRSGCGKSVLLKHIIGILKPDSGRISIDGEEITHFEAEKMYEIRKRFGMLFQGSALFDSLTVEENVGLGLKEHTSLPDSEIKEIVQEKLSWVGLSGVGNLKPAQLSGGMKKRVGLARAIAMEPECILYDEPTTGLDPIMADVINHLIIDMHNKLKVTSIAVTHDMVAAYKIADRIAMLHEGKIIFTGTPEETKNTTNPIVRQFIEGKEEGPIKAI